VVPPDSHRISRVRCYSGAARTRPGRRYRTVTFCGAPFQALRSGLAFPKCGPTTPAALTCHRFRLFRVRSPLLTESRLISSPVGTGMCRFPTFAGPPPMDSEEANSGCPELGCPIRGSPDKLVCSTPGLFAAYHALHRLSAPRHPPYTLSNLPALIRFPEVYSLAELADGRRLTAAPPVRAREQTSWLHCPLSRA
jgi:hypothetical protein